MKIEATAAVEHNVKSALKYVKYKDSDCSKVFDFFQLFYTKPYSDIPAGTIVYWILASFTDNFYILARPRKIEWLRENEWTDETEKERSG